MKKSLLLLGLLLSLSVFAHETNHEMKECDMKALSVEDGKVTVGDTNIYFGDGIKGIKSGNAWQGPVVFNECSVDIGIIEGPFFGNTDLLYVPTYSGSNSKVYLLDLNKCEVAWESRNFKGHAEISSKSIVLDGKELKINEFCVPVKDKKQ